MNKLKKLAVSVALTMGAMGAVQAAEDIKIGLVLPMSGPFASIGEQIHNGVKLYLEQNGDEVNGRKIKLLLRDDTGIAPEVSKRASQELVIKDGVEILAGYVMTPNAFSVAPIATSSKTPMIVLNAATSSIPERSPYIIRTSMTLPQVTAPLAEWALKNGIKRVYTIVADYGPGHDSEKQFIKTFTEGGGEIVDQIRTPVNNPDFAPYLQRAKDSKPDAVFLFYPASEQSTNFIKGYKERGMDKEGIALISTGDMVIEDFIDATGDAAEGIVTSFHYSEAHDSEINKKYVEAYKQAYPRKRPNYASVGGYDGMHLIMETLKKLDGKVDGDKFIEVAKNMKWESPRGSIAIDPETRDIVQDIYIRKAQKSGDLLQNIEFDVVREVKDPGKESRAAN